jgi:hypothetical protein
MGSSVSYRIKEFYNKIGENKSLAAIIGLIGVIVGVTINPAIMKISEHQAQKYLSALEIEYFVNSVDRFNQFNILEFSGKEKIQQFNFDLDDPIIKDYNVVTFTISNSANSIKYPVTLELNTNNSKSKIIDIKCKQIKPSNKIIPIEYDFPKIKWDDVKYNNFSGGNLSWDTTKNKNDLEVNYNIYRSLSENVGYGRLNMEPILEEKYRIENYRDSPPVYYKITSNLFGCSNENRIDSIVPNKFPYFFAFSGLFYNLDNSNDDRYRFLEGRSRLIFQQGLDDSSEFKIYCLYKTMYDEPINVQMKVVGSPEIKCSERKSSKGLAFEIVDKDQNLKEQLTPKWVMFFPANNGAYICWEPHERERILGVRIFKSKMREDIFHTEFGEEIYDGPVKKYSILKCKSTYGSSKWALEVQKGKEITVYNIPPQKAPVTDDSAPLPPVLHGPKGMRIIDEGEKINANYHYDSEVNPNEYYTYTILFYDTNNNYSIPIFVNAKIKDYYPNDSCICWQSPF